MSGKEVLLSCERKGGFIILLKRRRFYYPVREKEVLFSNKALRFVVRSSFVFASSNCDWLQ